MENSLNRRSFLGLVGGVLALASTPEFFSAIATVPAPVPPVHDKMAMLRGFLCLNKSDTAALLQLRRLNDTGNILCFAVPPHAFARFDHLSEAIYLPDGMASLCVTHPTDLVVVTHWQDRDGRDFMTHTDASGSSILCNTVPA